MSSNREKQVILLIIPKGKGCDVKCEGRQAKSKGRQGHYLAAKNDQFY